MFRGQERNVNTSQGAAARALQDPAGNLQLTGGTPDEQDPNLPLAPQTPDGEAPREADYEDDGDDPDAPVVDENKTAARAQLCRSDLDEAEETLPLHIVLETLVGGAPVIIFEVKYRPIPHGENTEFLVDYSGASGRHQKRQVFPHTLSAAELAAKLATVEQW